MATREVTAPPGVLGLTFGIAAEGGHPEVTVIAAASPLAGALSPGDVIVSIDGADMAGMPPRALVQRLRDGASSSRKLVVRAAVSYTHLTLPTILLV